MFIYLYFIVFLLLFFLSYISFGCLVFACLRLINRSLCVYASFTRYALANSHFEFKSTTNTDFSNCCLASVLSYIDYVAFCAFCLIFFVRNVRVIFFSPFAIIIPFTFTDMGILYYWHHMQVYNLVYEKAIKFQNRNSVLRLLKTRRRKLSRGKKKYAKLQRNNQNKQQSKIARIGQTRATEMRTS